MSIDRDPTRWPGDGVRWMGGAAAALLTLVLYGAPGGARSVAAAGAPSSPATGTIEEPTYLPAGVSDARGTVGCLRTPDGGVEAVDLATGRSLWRAAAPARALLVARGRAFVLEERGARRLRLATHAARAGRLARIYDLAALSLPPWASLAEPGAGREWTDFRAAARLSGEALDIRYGATRRRVSGFQGQIIIGRIEGVARVGLDSGRVTLPPGPAPAPPPITEPAHPMPGARLLSIHARAADATLVLGGPPANVEGALIVGSRRLLFELAPDARTVIVHGRHVPGGRQDPPLRLEHGRATDVVWVTLDRRHVLLRRADQQPWYDLYSLATGKSIGSLERPADVAVVGPRVFWTSLEAGGALTLTATEAGSGLRLWRRTVRDADPPPGPPIP